MYSGHELAFQKRDDEALKGCFWEQVIEADVSSILLPWDSWTNKWWRPYG